MTSTSITTVGGLVVVTQVFPQGETSIQLQTPDAPQQPTAKPVESPQPAPAKMDDMTAAFLRGEPHGLGIAQIFVGLLCALLSLTAIFSEILIVHAPFALGIAFVLSGSLAVAAGKQTSVGLVWASLVSNIIAAMISVAGLSYVSWLLADGSPSNQLCALRGFNDFKMFKCSVNIRNLNLVLYGLRGFLLVLLVLEVCVSVSLCVFSRKAIRLHGRRNCPIMVKVDSCSDVSLLDSEEKPVLPPYSP